MIEDIAEPVARAVQVALARSEREERNEQRFLDLERRLDELTKGLSKPRPSTA